MKKILIIILAISGTLTMFLSIAKRMMFPNSIAIIGGADGPTSVFIAGKVGESSWTPMIFAVVCLAAAVILWNRKK